MKDLQVSQSFISLPQYILACALLHDDQCMFFLNITIVCCHALLHSHFLCHYGATEAECLSVLHNMINVDVSLCRLWTELIVLVKRKSSMSTG